MQIIYSLKLNGSAIIRHDDIEFFANTEVVTYQGSEYVIEEYTGSKRVESDITLDDYHAEQNKTIAIGEINVTPVEPDFDDTDTQYTVFKKTPITGQAKLSTALPPGKKIRIPVLRVDTGREDFFIGEVGADGLSITISGQFETGGRWVIGNEQINSSFIGAEFDMSTLEFTVI